MNENHRDGLRLRIYELRRKVSATECGACMKFVVFPDGLTAVTMPYHVSQDAVPNEGTAYRTMIFPSYETAVATFISERQEKQAREMGADPTEELVEVSADLGDRVAGIEEIMQRAVREMQDTARGVFSRAGLGPTEPS